METTNSRAILLLCDYRAPYGGNFIASLRCLDRALSARGAKRLYVFPLAAKERAWCVRFAAETGAVAYLDDRAAFPRRLGALLALLQGIDAEILHVHFGFFPLAECAALRMPRLKLILHFHSDFSAGTKPSLGKRVKRICSNAVRALLGKRLQKVTVSESSAVGEGGCVPLHNALAPERYTDEVWDRETTRAAFRIGTNELFAIVFGWSPFVKGVDVAARAVRRLAEGEGAPWKLGVVCGRTYTEERMRAYLEERAGCGDAPWVRYLPPVEDVFRYHLAADAVISASRSETFSYALLEAVYAGAPCAASDIPGVQWVRAFDTVTFFPTEDDAALADAMRGIAARRDDPAFLAALDEASRAAAERYAIGDWVDGMLSLYGMGDGAVSAEDRGRKDR